MFLLLGQIHWNQQQDSSSIKWKLFCIPTEENSYMVRCGTDTGIIMLPVHRDSHFYHCPVTETSALSQAR